MNRNTAAGFTLIETIIALVLLSFVMVIGYQGLVFGVEQWHKGEERLESQYDYHQAVGWMRARLGSAEKAIAFGGDAKSYLFEGKTGEVEFVARFERARRPGLYVTRVYLDERDHSLYVAYYLHHPDVARNLEQLEPERVKLLPGVASLRISYYGRRSGQRKKEWHPGWRNQASLPQLLKLEIETVDGVKHESYISVLTSNNV
ncbi:MAG: prepilin-type N-terminal cleavage/methylation domain-containing protein [Gammaproteobacteria bacterium]|nr:prepilin-type N-terminal cleavage/methylation domain-containing protein [Gammaproteobacteria bacterium]MDH3534901.1 prepilin-type N-terminal cleavage/methylation domain-containing protein [Gammaproteobacteria bacterium]